MDEGSRNASKRRRSVVPTACVECRKKRTKCDGNQDGCSRCQSTNSMCTYEIPIRQSKDAMRNELQQLHTYHQQSELVFRSLTVEDKSADVLQRLRSGEALESIAIRLTTGSMQMDSAVESRPVYQSFDPLQAVFGPAEDSPTMDSPGTSTNISSTFPHESGSMQLALDGETRYDRKSSHESPESSNVSRAKFSVNWVSEGVALSQTNARAQWPIIGTWQSQPGSASGSSQRDRGQDFLFGPGSMNMIEPGTQEYFNSAGWANVINNTGLTDHLLALYFCWEYPTFASISKEHFLQDYRSGSQRFCSSLLINALLALGSRFSNSIEVWGEATDGSTAGDVFFAEALRLLRLDNSITLTTVQALGLMSIREASCGRDSNSLFYSGQSIRMACEMGLHKIGLRQDGSMESDLEKVQTATFWGAFALNIAWCMIAGRLPHLSSGITFMGKPAVEIEVESNEWVPYTDDGMPLERNANQPSNVRTIYKCFCELSETLHHSLYLLYTPGNQLTAGRLVGIYTTLLSWYGSLPEALRLGKNFTPAVLFVHMYYHLVVHHLFRPFIKIRLIGSSISPKDTCLQAADNISSLVRSYGQLYTLARTPSFVPHAVFSSTLTYLINQIPSSHNPVNSSSSRKFIQGVSDLKHMSPCHGFARTALRILRFLSKEWNIKELQDFWSGEEADEEGEREANDGVSISLRSMNYLCPDVRTFCEGLGDINSDYPLFSVFAMQGWPLMAEAEGLEEAGFRVMRGGEE